MTSFFLRSSIRNSNFSHQNVSKKSFWYTKLRFHCHDVTSDWRDWAPNKVCIYATTANGGLFSLRMRSIENLYTSRCKGIVFACTKRRFAVAHFQLTWSCMTFYIVGWRVRLGPRNARNNTRRVLLRYSGHADSSRLAGCTHQPQVGILCRSGLGSHFVSADSVSR